MKARPKEKKINPIYAFSFIYILYNMLGLVQYPWIIDNAYDKTIPWLAFLSGLSGLFIGAIFWRKKRISSGKSAKTQVNDRILGLIFLAIFIISIAATIIRSKGIPFLLGEDRLGISAVLFNFAQIYGFWVALKFIQAYEEGKTIQKKISAILRHRNLSFRISEPSHHSLPYTFLILYMLQNTQT